ncbi:MAG: decaprenyl-phosphate phosphoribosyltransferase [Myxococcota bacterium]
MSHESPALSAVPSPTSAPSPSGPPSFGLSLLRALRPRQWTKNAAVLAPLLFAKAVDEPARVLLAVLAVGAFCFLASAVYVLNDWRDREADRLHPEKKKRPIAAGHLGLSAAASLVLGCGAAGAGLAMWVGKDFALVAAGYVGLQLLYSFLLKRFVILDVMLIATGFVLRVIGGGVAIDVPVSNWLFLCTLLLAVFLGFAKRRHEVASLAGDAAAHRANLTEYSLPLLDQMMSAVAAACILAYGLYSVAPDTMAHVGSDKLKYSVPFVIYGIFRYLFLVHRRGAGGSPERVLLSDVPLIVDLALFVGVAGWALYAGG